MAKSEYQELVEFLGPKFDKIDARFEGIEGRLTRVEERLTGVEERLTRVEVLGEQRGDQIGLLAEAISILDRKVEVLREDMTNGFHGVRTEMAVGFEAVRSEMADGFERLGSRVTRLEGLSA
jgi:hypothetical protein